MTRHSTTPEVLQIPVFSWYCPALGMYRRPGASVPPELEHLLHAFDWIPLYAVGRPEPEHWTLRSYYSPTESSFYASHRTMSVKTAAQSDLVELFAPPGSPGNDTAGHVPPKDP